MITCVGLLEAVPSKSHRQQILHHAATFHQNGPIRVLYTVASESAVMYHVMVRFDDKVILAYRALLSVLHSMFADWTTNVPEVRDWGDAKDRETVELGFQLKKCLRDIVLRLEKPLPTPKYIKATLVYMWNLYKKGVDTWSRLAKNIEQYQEHKTPDQILLNRFVLKTIVNAWRCHQAIRSFSWVMSTDFVDIRQYHTYRNKKSLCLRDFYWEFTKELAQHLQKESMVPKAKAAKRVRNLEWFDSADGSDLRRGSVHHPTTGLKNHCMLCSVWSKKEVHEDTDKKQTVRTGGRPSQKCLECDVYLCTRKFGAFSRPCFEVWHEAKAGDLAALKVERVAGRVKVSQANAKKAKTARVAKSAEKAQPAEKRNKRPLSQG